MKTNDLTRPQVTKVKVTVNPILGSEWLSQITIEADKILTNGNFDFFPRLFLTDKMQYQIAGLRIFPNTSNNTVTYLFREIVFDNPHLGNGPISVRVAEGRDLDVNVIFEYEVL